MRKALIIGINDYKNAPLQGSVNDAKKIQNVLSHDEDGTPNFDCKCLTAPKDYITRASLKGNIGELFKDDADVALFYFSGHGFLNNLGGYLVTQDIEKYDEGVNMNDILTLANKAPIREVVIILDCCHSGAFGEVPSVNNNISFLREGISVITASSKTQYAMESDGSGIFTSLIFNALNGGAADICGNVTIAGLYNYVDQMLGAWDQRPMLKANVSKLISLRKCTAQIQPNILRLISEYFKSPGETFNLDPSFEPTVEPRNDKNETIFSHLQQFRNTRLLIVVGADSLYDAAINSKNCKLTPQGQFYWKLAESGKI